MEIALATTAALIALAFAMSTFERWLARRRRHELAWSIALGFFFLASASLAAGAAWGWNGPLFRLFYLFGAIVNVPFLALGTVYLLWGQKQGDRIAVGVVILMAFAAGVLAVTPLTGPIPRAELAQGSEVFGPLPRILAATSSGLGALVVIGGAVWSAIRRPSGRTIGANSLIALGTAITGISGILNSAMNEMDAFAVTLVIGISVIFLGFLIATGGPRPSITANRAEKPTLRAITEKTA